MVERPDRIVREALVVALDVVGAECDRHQERTVELERLEIDIGLPAQPTHAPSAFCMTGSSAVTRPAPEISASRSAVRVHRSIHRKAVGDDDELGLVHSYS